MASRKKSKSRQISFNVYNTVSAKVFARKLREWLIEDCKNQTGFGIVDYDLKVIELLKSKKKRISFIVRR